VNEDVPKSFSEAVQQWREKHRIGDDDPVLATADLMEALLRAATTSDSASKYHEIRRELEELDRLCKAFLKQSGEVVREVRAVPKIKEELWMFPYFTVMLIATISLVTGLLIGKLLH
jgi:ElaB/YqjD/DUF883 family membrane-anchored ribosome-binding protein